MPKVPKIVERAFSTIDSISNGPWCTFALIINFVPKSLWVHIPNPDKPEKWPQRHKDTKQNCLLKFIFVFWCLGGEHVLPQNAQK